MLMLISPVAVEAASLMNYQGVLTEPDGTPASGIHKLSFSLYETPSATAAIWGPQVFGRVPVTDGHYAVILGTTDNMGRNLDDIPESGEYVLSIQLDDQETATRLSMEQTKVRPPDKNLEHKDDTPSGIIVAYTGHQIPEGWLLCDGSLIPEGNQYDRLREQVGHSVPDLRGLFLRGLGQNSKPEFHYAGDDSRAILQLQQDELAHHEHPVDDYTFSENAGSGGTAWGHLGQSDIDNAPASPYRHNTHSYGGEETRPNNAGVHWIIKY